METDKSNLVARPYQSMLEDIAIKKNTIIHLPTGSGKTFIAIRLIARFKEALRKPWGQGGKRTFFLVNTVPLVTQQKKVIELQCPVKSVVGYSSEDGVDYWKKEKWNNELSKYQVIVMTSQILADMLTHRYISIKDINLIIFDECHHAVNDHPMRLVMKHFEGCAKEEHPRVLGLTATLLNANIKAAKVESSLRDLESTFHATIATVNELGEVLTFSTNPREYVIYYTTFEPTSANIEACQVLTYIGDIISTIELPIVDRTSIVELEMNQQDITTDPKKITKKVYNMTVAIIKFIKEMGTYGGCLSIVAYIVLLERLKRRAVTKEEENLYQITITYLLKARMILLEGMKGYSGYEKILKFSSEKIHKLLDVLKEYNPTYFERPGVVRRYNQLGKQMSCIIFVKERFTSKILYNLLKEVVKENPEEFGFLQHDFIVGFNMNPFSNTREQYYLKKASQKSLLDFSNGRLNCLISTSVIEEGVDIPRCLLVLRYDQPLEYRSYIQSKGRARSSDSNYIIFVDNVNKQIFQKQYEKFINIESILHKILVGKTDSRSAPSDETIQNFYDEDDLPPYVTEHGARLSSVSAISLLNRYCSSLHHDQFTTLSPMWIQEDVEEFTGRYKSLLNLITVMLPTDSPVKETIKGIPHTQLKIAKRSAALNACIKLHEAGELDEYTLLPRVYGKVDFEDPNVRQCFLNWPWDDEEKIKATEGSTKILRKYKKVFPSCLKGPVWNSGTQNMYLHIINLKPAFVRSSDSRDGKLYDLLKRPEGFGLLTSSKLPKVCDFPMFLTIGEVSTSLLPNFAVVKLDLARFELIKLFHLYIFDKVLKIAGPFIAFDGTTNAMYVIPIKADNEIDWDLMIDSKEMPKVEPPSYEEKRALNITPDNYRHHIVSPWYRTTSPDDYMVTNVLEYMTPQSAFETDGYNSYAEYYKEKYKLDIVGDRNQPLLEVRNITSRMNCLLPRSTTIKNQLTDKQLKQISDLMGEEKQKQFNEVLIPEFCIKFDFPGVLWLKAMILPSIIHRLTHILVALDLRNEIAKEINYGRELLPHEEWQPIEADMHIAVEAMISQLENPSLNTVDRINIDQVEVTQPSVFVPSLKDALYKLKQQKIANEYPWDERSEPLDIERNISSVTLLDIECYDKFVTTRVSASCASPSPLSPVAPSGPTAPAILPTPVRTDAKIEILSKSLEGRGPEVRDVLAALTSIKSHDSFNLERAETLGDSFLKFVATLYLFHKFPTLSEGQLTNIKGRLVGNRNLFYAAEKKNLAGRMKVELFNPRGEFTVPAFSAAKELQQIVEEKRIRPTFLMSIELSLDEKLSGKMSDEHLSQVKNRYECDQDVIPKETDGFILKGMQSLVRAQIVQDKATADCVEALLGTYLLSGGVLAAIKFLEWMKILPPKDNFASYLNKKIPTALSEKNATIEDIDFLLYNGRQEIEEILQYKFNDPSLLLQALTHPSYIRNRKTGSYERLEFLGDAILDFLITTYVFETNKNLKPGDLTDLRSALVNNVTFASFVVKLGLHKYICSQLNPLLEGVIATFVDYQEQRGHQIVEDVLYLIDEESCQLAEYVEVPKVLSDVFESLMGAIYLDCGGELATVWRIVYRIMRNEIAAFSARIPLQPVRVLMENVHACPTFGKSMVTKSEVPRVMMPVTFTNKGSRSTVYGCGANKFQAKRAAAKMALKVLAHSI